MRHLGLCLLAIVALCSGQMCGGPLPAQYPTAEELGSPIAEGTYAGSVTAKYSVGAGLAPLSDRTVSTTYQFGRHGLPLTETNEPIYVGYAETADVGGQTMALTVRSINATSDGISVDEDVTWILRADGEEFPLTGMLSETFILRGDSKLDFRGSLYVAATVGTRFFWMGMEMSGELASCTGQACASLANVEEDQRNSLPSVIPEGIYSGAGTTHFWKAQGGVTITDWTDEGEVRQVIGHAGWPITETNEPVYVGWTMERVNGPAVYRSTVTGLGSVTNGITIEGTLEERVGSGADALVLTGRTVDQYILEDDGSVTLHSNYFIQGVALGVLCTEGQTVDATLTR